MSDCKYKEGTSREEVIIKALGTMIMKYDSAIDPETFKTFYTTPRQVSILSDESRVIAEAKLIELISKYE